MKSNDDNSISKSRRKFIKKASIFSLTSLGLTHCGNDQDEYQANNDGSETTKKPITKAGHEESKIKSYRKLGDTGLKASDISFGSGWGTDYRVILRAIDDIGINYFDTAPDYGGGEAEKTLGKAFKKMSIPRDKIVITTKFCARGGYPNHYYHEKKETYIKGVEDSLKKLNTDYADFLLVHALGEKDKDEMYRLKDSEMLEAAEKLKKDGKIRFLGISSHSYHAALEGQLDYAIDSGIYKLLMLAYSFRAVAADKFLPKLMKLSKKAHSKGVAFVAMKTLNGARGLDPGLFKGKGTFAQAAFKWVLSNPAVSCLVKTMSNIDQVQEYVKASGQKFSFQDEQVLYRHSAIFSKDCVIGCSDCESACPQNIPISNILRYNKYFQNYDQQKEAMTKYSLIPISQRASSCLNCNAPCEQSCSYGVSIKRKLNTAHKNLLFT